MLPVVADASGPQTTLNRRAFIRAGGGDGNRKDLAFSHTIDSSGQYPKQSQANLDVWGSVSVSYKAPQAVKTAGKVGWPCL